MNNETNSVNPPVLITKRTHSLWYFLTGMLVGLLLIGGFFYWYTLQDKPINETLVDEPIATSTVQAGTVTLNTLPISFNLPPGYISLQRETFEGGYSTTIITGVQTPGQNFLRSPFEIFITSYVRDSQLQKDFPADEYVDVVYKNKLQSGAKPQYVELFGNKAVKYTEEVDSSTTLVGYIRSNQLPNYQSYQTDLGVKITSSTYGYGVEENKPLFDTVVNSIKIK